MPRPGEAQLAFTGRAARNTGVRPHQVLHIRKAGALESLTLLRRYRNLPYDLLQIRCRYDCGACSVSFCDASSKSGCRKCAALAIEVRAEAAESCDIGRANHKIRAHQNYRFVPWCVFCSCEFTLIQHPRTCTFAIGESLGRLLE